MRFLIVGLGSIGRRHLKNIRLTMPHAHITVWRQHAQPTQAPDNDLADHTVYQMADALDQKPDVALICSPATRHIDTALQMAEQGIHLFVEKPLSHSLANVDRLLLLCQQQKLILMVGYNLRFNRPLMAAKSALDNGRIGRPVSVRVEVGQHLPDWRPEANYRHGVSAQRNLGGGVLLELSHELDYVRWLMGEVKAVQAQIDHLSDLEIDVEDIAEIGLRFADGTIGSVHLDMIQRPPMRMCRIVGTESVLEWDGIANCSRVYNVKSGGWQQLAADTQDRNAMYVDEIRHLVTCIQGETTPIVTGEDGRRILEIIAAARESADNGGLVQI
jgi:predicted dehydrogenase